MLGNRSHPVVLEPSKEFVRMGASLFVMSSARFDPLMMVLDFLSPSASKGVQPFSSYILYNRHYYYKTKMKKGKYEGKDRTP